MRPIHYMTPALRIAVLLALFFAIPTDIHGQWREDNEAAPDNDWAKHEGQFGAMLFLSDKPEAFLNAWNQPTEGVPIQTTDTVPRGVPIVAFVVFTGCAPDNAGLCNASIDFTVLKPDGSEYSRHEDADLWKSKPAIEEGALQLSADYIGVVVEPDDPLGLYTVQVTAHDRNANIKLGLVQHFTATEKSE